MIYNGQGVVDKPKGFKVDRLFTVYLLDVNRKEEMQLHNSQL